MKKAEMQKQEIRVLYTCWSQEQYNGYQTAPTLNEAMQMAAEFNKRCEDSEFSYDNEDGDGAEVIIYNKGDEWLHCNIHIDILQTTIESCIQWLQSLGVWEQLSHTQQESLKNSQSTTEAIDQQWRLYSEKREV